MYDQTYDDNPFAASDIDARGAFGTTPYGTMEVADVLFSFEGRIPRSTYWMAHLSMVGVLTGIYILAAVISEDLFALTFFLTLIPAVWAGLAIEVKRWHDLGYSGWMVLLGLIPYLGGLIKFVMCGFLPSDEDNLYGPMPL